MENDNDVFILDKSINNIFDDIRDKEKKSVFLGLHYTMNYKTIEYKDMVSRQELLSQLAEIEAYIKAGADTEVNKQRLIKVSTLKSQLMELGFNHSIGASSSILGVIRQILCLFYDLDLSIEDCKCLIKEVKPKENTYEQR